MYTLQVSLASSVGKVEDIQEMYRAQTEDSIDIWELATQHLVAEVPDDIWEVVCKLYVYVLALSHQILIRALISLSRTLALASE